MLYVISDMFNAHEICTQTDSEPRTKKQKKHTLPRQQKPT